MIGRDTPPSIQDGQYGFEPDKVSNFEQAESAGQQHVLADSTAVKIGREIFESSTNWLNSGRRARWNDSLRAFQNMHPSGSKYTSSDYRFRSSLYRPKTRAMIRRDEAATASAYFSNEDVVSITAADDDDPKQQASAEILKCLLQYRLADAEGEDLIPWFLTVVGARQDADTMGICVSKVGWKYEERFVKTDMKPLLGPDGAPIWDEELQRMSMQATDIYEKTADHPFIDLIAPENLRFEPGCDWRNPVRSSPYLVEMVPVYINEALERMASQNGAPAEWRTVSTSALRGATDMADDVTRRSREQGRVPGKDHDSWKPRDFDICWTRQNIVRWGGQDWYYRTLGSSGELLEAPRPLREVVLHGERPYVVGCVVLETHKTYPSSKVELTSDLQRAANQDWNSRFDAVMLGLQPRQFVREGHGQDINDLRQMMPGKVVMVNGRPGEPLTNQITWDRPPPVDGASFQEQDRINLDWDDLTGAFTNSSQASSQITQQSATGMHLMSGEASGLNEYELRIFTETFVEPTLRLLIKTEQAYETDSVILGLAAKKANLLQRFGIDKVTDDLLNAGVTVRVNVGIGATNPQMKLRNFATGAQILGSLFGPAAAQGANFQEVSKELFGLLGYRDGARFFQPGFDPRVTQMQQQLAKHKGPQQPDQSKVQAAQIQAQSRIQERQIQSQTDSQMMQMDYNIKKLSEDANTMRTVMKLQHDQTKQGQKLGHDTYKQQQDIAHDIDQQQQGFAHDHQLSARGFMQDQQTTQQGFAHDQNMAQQAAMQSQQAAMQGFQHDQNMATQGFQQQQSLQPQDADIPMPASKSPEDAEMDRMLVQYLGRTITSGLTQMAQVVQQGNETLANMIAQSNEASAKNSAAIVAAVTRKKNVVRGIDGKVLGVE